MDIINKAIRILPALLIAVLYYTRQISALAAVILGIAALAFLLGGFVKSCPLLTTYRLMKYKRAEKESK